MRVWGLSALLGLEWRACDEIHRVKKHASHEGDSPKPAETDLPTYLPTYHRA